MFLRNQHSIINITKQKSKFHTPSSLSRACKASGVTAGGGGSSCSWSYGISRCGNSGSASVTVLVLAWVAILVNGNPSARVTGTDTPSFKSTRVDSLSADITPSVLLSEMLLSEVIGVSGRHSAVFNTGKLASSLDTFSLSVGPNGIRCASSTSRRSLNASVLL